MINVNVNSGVASLNTLTVKDKLVVNGSISGNGPIYVNTPIISDSSLTIAGPFVINGKQFLINDNLSHYSTGMGGTYGLYSPTSNDGTVVPGVNGGLLINPLPQPFVSTVPQSGFGTLDHVKYLAYRADGDTPATGLGSNFSAFTAPTDGTELVYECPNIAAQQTFASPIPAAIAGGVIDQNKDPRLCCAGMAVLDPDNLLTFDVLFTNTEIYAIYERLPFGKPGWPASPPAYTGPDVLTSGDYHGFTHLIPLGCRQSGVSPLSATTRVQFAYNKALGYARWLINGDEKFRISKIGCALDSKYRVLDHDGPDVLVSPNRLSFGFCLFSLLDMHEPSQQNLSDLALVQLCTPNQQYVNPRLDRIWPGGNPQYDSTFLDPTSNVANRLFGQGVQLSVDKVLIYTRGVILE